MVLKDRSRAYGLKMATGLEPGLTRFEWLLAGPARKSIPALEAQTAKIAFLRDIGADRLPLDLPDAEVTRLARRVTLRKASNLERITKPQRTIELACFLKHRLEVLTDGTIDLFNHLVNNIVRRARDRAIRTLARQASPLQALAAQIDGLVQNEDLSGDELRASLVALIKPFRSERRPITRAMATRQVLCVVVKDLSRLLAVATELEFNLPDTHLLAEAFGVLDIATDISQRILVNVTIQVEGHCKILWAHICAYLTHIIYALH